VSALERTGDSPGRPVEEKAALERMIFRRGVPASGGLAAGAAHIVQPHEEHSVEDRLLSPGEEMVEARRFRLAVRRALDEIQALQECLLGEPEDTGRKILDAHRMLLDDQEFQRKVIEGIHAQRRPADFVLSAVFKEMTHPLLSAGSEYFRARAADLEDIKRRVLKHLMGGEPAAAPIPRGSIIVAADLSPSETTSFDPDAVRALVTDHGGPTSHAAILARSRGIPAVVGLIDLAGQVREGDQVLVDGHRGIVIVRPGARELEEFEEKLRREEHRIQVMTKRGAGPAVTLDGHPVTLLANIEEPEDTPNVLRAEAEGVGLYRTEFFYLRGPTLPDEEGQFRAYRRIAESVRPRPVTIRTLDAGGDKFAAYLGTSRENNPFLGLRGIRFSLGHTDLFRTQLRAILRASAFGNVRILYPMISSIEEVREANRLVDEVAEELRREGRSIPEKIPRGIMIEVPAAVVVAEDMARETDFFSIGSNDLIQYTLAVDRENEKLAYLYDPFHPAVLRSLAQTVRAADRAGIPVSSCGEMSGSVYGAAVLIGLGCTSLSMTPYQIREIRGLVRRVRVADLRRLAEELMRQATVTEVHALLEEALGPLAENGSSNGPGEPSSSASPGESTGESNPSAKEQ
jgi:phosphotransferase system enzyme I (PtsI)